MIKVYDTSRNLVADIKNDYGVHYEMRENEIWTAGFTIPADDPHADEVTARRYVEIYDQGDRLELFRIRKITHRDGDQQEIVVECEHVLATLLDATLDTITYSGPGTSVSIGDVLALQSDWALGTCDFTAQYLYSWQRGTNLWKCLQEIVDRLHTGYLWTVDTVTHPWTLNLLDDETVVSAYVDYGRNLRSIEKEEDTSGLVTRLYAWGYGSGEDQIGIASENPSGEDYIDSGTGTYGVIDMHWSDQRYTTAAQLYTAAGDYLSTLSTPKLTYRVSAADLSDITGETIDEFTLGKLLRVEDPDLDIAADVRIVAISKSDVTGSPGDIAIELGNKSREFDLRTYVQANDLSGITITNLQGGSPGGLPGALGDAGLYITTEYLGYWDGSSWASYFDSLGRLYLEHGTYYFRFNPVAGTLSIKVSALDISATTGIVGEAQIANLAVTDAKIATLSVSKLTAGTIDAQTVTLAETNGSAIRQGKTHPTTDTTSGFWLGQAAGAVFFHIGDATTYMLYESGVGLEVKGNIKGEIGADLDMNSHVLSNAGDIRGTSYPSSGSPHHYINPQTCVWVGETEDCKLSLTNTGVLEWEDEGTVRSNNGNLYIEGDGDIRLHPNKGGAGGRLELEIAITTSSKTAQNIWVPVRHRDPSTGVTTEYFLRFHS